MSREGFNRGLRGWEGIESVQSVVKILPSLRFLAVIEEDAWRGAETLDRIGSYLVSAHPLSHQGVSFVVKPGQTCVAGIQQ